MAWDFGPPKDTCTKLGHVFINWPYYRWDTRRQKCKYCKKKRRQ